MISFQLKEFVPPIVYRVRNFIIKKGPKYLSDSNKTVMPPYDEIPPNTNVKWIMDIGANIGNLSESALVSYPNSKVVCFEPVKDTFEQLSSKLSKFGDRVYLNNFALADINGTSEINLTNFNGANSLAKQSEFHKEMNPGVREKSTETVTLKKLDDISRELPSQFFDIVKIDVEGFELNVLKGGIEFFKNSVDTVIIEVSLMRDTSLSGQAIFEIFKILNEAGFSLYNMFDLNYSGDKNAPFKLVQMDCVFKKVK
jgi:FkbM family methyltransferase